MQIDLQEILLNFFDWYICDLFPMFLLSMNVYDL